MLNLTYWLTVFFMFLASIHLIDMAFIRREFLCFVCSMVSITLWVPVSIYGYFFQLKIVHFLGGLYYGNCYS